MTDEIKLLRKALERAERDAQRWEKAAVGFESVANAAGRERRKAVEAAEAKTEEMRARLENTGEGLIAALDELAKRVSLLLDVPLPPRGCYYDDEDD